MGIEDKLKNLSPTKAAVIGLVIGALYFGIADKGAETEQQIAKAQSEIATESETLKRSQAAKADFENFKKQLLLKKEIFQQAAERLPLTINAADIMSSATKLIEGGGGKILKVEPRPPIKSSSMIEDYPLHIIFEGNYGVILNFLSALTRQNQITKIPAFTLSARDVASGSEALKFEADVMYLRYLPGLPPSSADKAAPEGAK